VVAIAVRSSSTVTQRSAPSTVVQLAREIRLRTPGATVPSGALVSSSWTPPRISSSPTLAAGSSSRATAARPDIRSRSW
jgi:hypothetical protein